MSTVSVLNTDAALSAKTLVTAEGTTTQTGLITFDRDPNPPFAVTSGSVAVANLNAGDCAGLGDTESITGLWTFNAGIKFPTTQVQSADANVLDDYEEGTWTPAFGGTGGQSGQTHNIQVGTYIKVGKLVTIQGRVGVSVLGTLTGTVRIKDLPYTSDTATNNFAACVIPFFSSLTTSVISLSGYIAPNTNVIELQMLTAAATGTGTVAQANLSNNTDMVFTATYRTNG